MYKLVLFSFFILSSFLYSNKNTIGFDNFEIYKVKNNLSSFVVKDLDGDKLKDILFIDNSDASIAIYYQQNNIEMNKSKEEFYRDKDELDVNKLSFNFKYKNIPFIAEKTITSMTVANVGGGELEDLIYLTSTGELFIKYQKSKRNFIDGQFFRIPDYLNSEYALVAKDINNDKKSDLVLLGKKYLYIFYQNNKSKLNMPIKYSYSSKAPLGIEVSDLNGDGLNDILFVTSGGINQIRVKFQLKNNTIGPDNIIDYPNFHFLTTKNILKNKKSQFISSRGGAHIILIDEIEKVKKKEDIKPSIYSLNPEAVSNNKSIVFDDFDNDNKKDLVVSDPMLPSIMFFKGDNDGFKNYKEYPILKDISKLISYKILGKNKIIAFSQKDAALVLYNLDKKYPDFIINKDKIEGIAKKDDFLYWIVSKNGEHYLEKIKILNDFKVNILFSRKIDNSPSTFDDFIITDINNDKKEDILFSVPYEGTKIFTSSGYNILPLDIKVDNIKSFLTSINKDQVKVMDFNKDGKDDIIISNKGMIRVFTHNEVQGLKIIAQINGVTTSSDLTIPVKSDIFENETDLVFFDKSNSKLYLINNKTLEIKKEILINGIEVNNILSINIDKDNANEFILLGRKSIAIYDNNNLGYKLKNIISYRIPKDKSMATMLEVGNFNDKTLISIDGFEHSVNFFKIEKNTLKSIMNFKVFDAISYQGRNNVRVEEPKHIMIFDMNNDGKDDIILYIHDKLLIYYQE
jgi:hypothetical protein